jgi:plasmid maintenance system antidote protein VapI
MGDMKQAELARLVGLPREQVNGYVTGRLKLGDKNATRFGKVLGVDPAELVTSERPPNGDLLMAKLDELAAEIRKPPTMLEAGAKERYRSLHDRLAAVEELVAQGFRDVRIVLERIEQQLPGEDGQAKRRRAR